MLFEETRHELDLTDTVRDRYKNPDNDPRGEWQSVSINAQAGHGTESQFYTIVTPGGRSLDPPAGRCWSVSNRRFEELVADNRIYFGATGNNAPRLKKFFCETERGLTPETIWYADEVDTTDKAMKAALFVLHGSNYFDTPKPPRLIQRILQIASDKDSIILDSFAGSGTTGHAVLKQNAEDGGNRKFILVEMEGKIAQDITAERVRRVAGGYTNAKGEPVKGLGSGFQFCRLSEEPLFNEFGDIRDDVTFAQLADFVWFAETGEGYTGKADSPLLGTHGGVAVYLLFNGILGDRRPAGGNILTPAVLASLPEYDGLRVIYAAAVKGIGPAALARANIIFKQTPYAIEV